MKIGNQTKVTIVGKNEREYTTRDGKQGKSYSVAIMQDGQVANVSCTEDVYNNVLLDPSNPFEIGVILASYYDDQYQRFVFDRVLQGATNAKATAK